VRIGFGGYCEGSSTVCGCSVDSRLCCPAESGREHRMVPHLVVYAQTDKPAEPQVTVQLLNQLPLRTHRYNACNNNARGTYLEAIDGPADADFSQSKESLNETLPDASDWGSRAKGDPEEHATLTSHN